MDKEMMRALQADRAMLEALGAGEQILEFSTEDGNRICDDCLDNLADIGSHLCLGCEPTKNTQ